MSKHGGNPQDYSGDPSAQFAFNQLGNPYSGVKMNLVEWYEWGRTIRQDKGFLILTPIAFPIMAIDLPCSLVGDTLYLPADLMIKSEHPPIRIRRKEDISPEDEQSVPGS